MSEGIAEVMDPVIRLISREVMEELIKVLPLTQAGEVSEPITINVAMALARAGHLKGLTIV